MALPFLKLLGLDARTIQSSPTPNTFPPLFNPQARHLWPAAVEQALELRGVENQWQEVLAAFVRLAVAKNIFPYARAHQQASNDRITSFLFQARTEVVKYVNRSGLLDLVSLRRGTRSATVLDTGGFLVVVDCNVDLRDPTFPDWITSDQDQGRRFLKLNSKYIKQLAPGVQFVIYNEGADMTQRWHVSYEIHCPYDPAVPGTHMPTTLQMEKFALDILWNPILKSVRPDRAMLRLF